MNALRKISGLIVLCGAVNVTLAQQPAPPADTPAPTDTAPAAAKPSKGTAQSEAGEPRANTSRAPTAQSEAGEHRQCRRAMRCRHLRPYRVAEGQQAVPYVYRHASAESMPSHVDRGWRSSVQQTADPDVRHP